MSCLIGRRCFEKFTIYWLLMCCSSVTMPEISTFSSCIGFSFKTSSLSNISILIMSKETVPGNVFCCRHHVFVFVFVFAGWVGHQPAWAGWDSIILMTTWHCRFTQWILENVCLRSHKPPLCVRISDRNVIVGLIWYL